MTAKGPRIGGPGAHLFLCLFSILREQSSASPQSYGSEHGLGTHDDQIPNSHQPMAIQSQTRDTVTKFEQVIHTIKNNLGYHTTYSADLPNWPKYLGYLKKGLSGCPQSVGQSRSTIIALSAIYILTTVSQSSFKEFRRGPILVKVRSLSNFIQNRYIYILTMGDVVKNCKSDHRLG